MNKKLLVLSAIIVVCIFAVPILIGTINMTEMTLGKSMEETQQEHGKIDQFITKANQRFQTKYNGEASVGFTFEKRIANVQVGNKQLVNKHGKEMKSLIRAIANEIELDNISVKVNLVDYVSGDVSKEEQTRRDLFDKVSKTTTEILKQNGFEMVSMLISPGNSNYHVEITLPFTEKLNENDVDELEKKVKQAISTKTDDNFDVTIKKKTEKQARDEKWQPTFRTIVEETGKKFTIVAGVPAKVVKEISNNGK